MIRKVLGGVLLIAGTSVGAAVLALPINTAHMGFQRSAAIFLVSWIFMTFGALYLLEANLKVGVGTNMISIAKHTTGRLGELIAWLAYLALLFSLTSAYLTGASNWLEGVLAYFGTQISFDQQLMLVTLITAAIILMGTITIDFLNRFLMLGLIGAYCALSFAALPHIDFGMLEHTNQVFDATQLPLIITAFGFAIIVPSLVLYLNGNADALVKVVLIGSLLPLIMYLSWEALILGLIPFDNPEHGLHVLQTRDKPAADLSLALQSLLGHAWIVKASHYFAIFALATSLLGVSLSLFDFLADGFNLKKTGFSRIGLGILTFAPPYLIVKFFPMGFSYGLKFAGIFVAILLGILPVWMVWRARYRNHLHSAFEVKGGKPMLLLTLSFFACIVYIQLATLFDWYVP